MTRNVLEELMKNWMIDLHCHILPSMDDGPKTMEESLEMCRMAHQDGIRAIVASPHTQNGVYVNTKKRILEAIEELKKRLRSANLEIEIFQGSEVRVNAEIPRMIQDGRVTTLNHLSNAVLLEFPGYMIPNVSCRFLQLLTNRGIIPVIGHPERIPQLRDLSLVKELVQMGALIQVAAGSLTGVFGTEPRALCRAYLEQRLVHVIASEAHSPHDRPPVLSSAVEEAAEIVGMEQARLLVTDNPRSIIRGKRPKRLEPIASRKTHRSTSSVISAPTKLQQRSENEALSISVLSNKGGVGKTHFSINLAYALAKAGDKVLLIDADFCNADVSNKLGILPEYSLLDFLTKDLRMQELIIGTEFNFDLICSKCGQPVLANLNYGQRLRFVNHFKSVRQDYDFVIFDLGAGITWTVLDFGLAADRIIILTTPQDLISGYACAKSIFFRYKEIEERLEKKLSHYTPQWTFSPMIVINKVSNIKQTFNYYDQFVMAAEKNINAKEVRFRIKPKFLGPIPYTWENFLKAEINKKPLLQQFPHIKASQIIQHMSKSFHNPEKSYGPVVNLRHPFKRFIAVLSQAI
jgi:protein-tyrosine phosphatase